MINENYKQQLLKIYKKPYILKQNNPRFEHYLYDDNDCREFIKNNFDENVVNAYDKLIPGAYKADLWRLCVLYIHGGIYMDIKLKCINGFRLIELTENNHFVKDRPGPLTVYNALIVSQKGNPFLWMGICRIIMNVKNNFYGIDALSPTGPRMLGNIILRRKLRTNIDMAHYEKGGYIIYKNRFVISTEYPEYNKERSQAYSSTKIKRYDIMWRERKIYK
jgi:mannosyltransferase OCH1-like enzyme